MLVSLLIASLAFGQDAPAPDASWSQIVNGQRENGFPTAVGIGFLFGDFRYQACSASLIAPRMLLTAGHCTAEIEEQQHLTDAQIVENGAVFVGSDVNTAEQVVGFESVHVHPKYSGSNGSIRNDIQVIVLDQDVDQKPVWFRSELLTSDEAIGTDVVSVGFGITSSDAQNSSGVKRSAVLTVADMDDQFLYSYAQQNKNNANVCSGDSGGPQYHLGADGRYTQWAVHSFVFAQNGSQDPCKIASGSTRTDAFADFVLGQVEDVYGTVDWCTINRAYSDRICDLGCAQPDPVCKLDTNTDGVVDDAEFARGDRDGDGVLSEGEALRLDTGCNQSGSGPVGLLALGSLLLAVRRRR